MFVTIEAHWCTSCKICGHEVRGKSMKGMWFWMILHQCLDCFENRDPPNLYQCLWELWRAK